MKRKDLKVKIEGKPHTGCTGHFVQLRGVESFVGVLDLYECDYCGKKFIDIPKPFGIWQRFKWRVAEW